MTLESFVYIALLLWGVITTIYGLWLSRRNNELYNKRIIELLEDIKNGRKES